MFTPNSPAVRASLLAAVAIVVGNMVGTGVFSSLGFQAGPIPSAFPIMLLWMLGGVLAFCGAVNYAELTAAFPRSGGEYQLLSRVFHPGIGFVSGWVSMIAGFSLPVAAAALVFGKYTCAIFGGESDAVALLVAAGLVVAVTIAHFVSVAFSGRFQWIATALNVLLILTLSVCAFVLPAGQPVSFLPQAGDGALIWGRESRFLENLIYVLYAYSGWNAACYIAGEVERPERNVPRALLLGTALVTLLYMALNAAMLFATPMTELAGSQENVAFVASAHIFGESGGRIMAGLIAAALLSSISAMTWAGPRVSQQMGRDYPLLAVLARTTPAGVPWVAMLLQMCLVLFLIFTSNVREIMNRTIFLLEIILLLTVWGVVHLRIRQPDLPRPCRAWGYPWTTGIFLIMIAFTLANILLKRPEDTRWGVAILITGAGFYWLARPPQAKPA